MAVGYSAELLLRVELDNNTDDIKVRCKMFWIEKTLVLLAARRKIEWTTNHQKEP